MNILIVSLYPLEGNTSIVNSSISIVNNLFTLGQYVSVFMPVWHGKDTGCY